MNIYDLDGNPLTQVDRRLGRLVPDKRLLRVHPAQAAQEERSHTELLRAFPGGGREVRRVVDVPAREAGEPWEEYEDIWRFVPYSPEELEQASQPEPQDQTDALLIDHELRLTLLELG